MLLGLPALGALYQFFIVVCHYHASKGLNNWFLLFSCFYGFFSFLFSPALLARLFRSAFTVLLAGSPIFLEMFLSLLRSISQYQNISTFFEFCLFTLSGGFRLSPDTIRTRHFYILSRPNMLFSTLTIAHSLSTFRTLCVNTSIRSFLVLSLLAERFCSAYEVFGLVLEH